MEGALDHWTGHFPSEELVGGEGPQVVPDLERRKHSTVPLPPTTTTWVVYAGIPAWTGGRHFLGMANPVPQPNRGAAVGCDGQRLQESKQAPGAGDMFPSYPGQGCPLEMGGGLPQASQ